MTNEEISKKLWNEIIPKEQLKNVMDNNYYAMAEICSDYMGFVKTYYNLSQIIPNNYTIIDIGCAYNPQCYLFPKHKKVISVEPNFKDEEPMFQSPNCEIYRTTAKGFIENILPMLNLNLDETFVICNYVPNWHGEQPRELVQSTFKNVYTFYPYNTTEINDKEQ